MLETSKVTYFQKNIGAIECDFNHTLTISEVAILLNKCIGNKNVFCEVVSPEHKSIISNFHSEDIINNFFGSIEKEKQNIFYEKAKEQGYEILEQHGEFFLCHNKEQNKFCIWNWFFYNKEFGNGYYSYNLSGLFEKWNEIKSTQH